MIEPTHFKNMQPSNWMKISPIFGIKNINKTVWVATSQTIPFLRPRIVIYTFRIGSSPNEKTFHFPLESRQKGTISSHISIPLASLPKPSRRLQSIQKDDGNRRWLGTTSWRAVKGFGWKVGFLGKKRDFWPTWKFRHNKIHVISTF